VLLDRAVVVSGVCECCLAVWAVLLLMVVLVSWVADVGVLVVWWCGGCAAAIVVFHCHLVLLLSCCVAAGPGHCFVFGMVLTLGFGCCFEVIGVGVGFGCCFGMFWSWHWVVCVGLGWQELACGRVECFGVWGLTRVVCECVCLGACVSVVWEERRGERSFLVVAFLFLVVVVWPCGPCGFLLLLLCRVGRCFFIGFLGRWAVWAVLLLFLIVLGCLAVRAVSLLFFGVVVLTLGCCVGCDVFWRSDGEREKRRKREERIFFIVVVDIIGCWLLVVACCLLLVGCWLSLLLSRGCRHRC